MTTRNSLLQQLPLLFEDWNKAKQKLETLNKKQIDTAVREIFEKIYQQDIKICWDRLNQALEDYDFFPDRFHDHLKDAVAFWKDGDFNTSVFIMTKFPDDADIQAGQPGAIQLQKVIDCVKEEIVLQGYNPRIADKAIYTDWLWDNVELHLLCCKYGIAILEDKYRDELNPNVALEWGWMKGMGRKVIFLKEKDFAKERADWFGHINHPFDWDNPKVGIHLAISNRLPKN